MIGDAGLTRQGLFILLRRLRAPLVLLIVVYAISVAGFTLVPGQDPEGRPWRMSFLHAFYFVSFLGTTIGLGEIPYPFSDAQRLWATASIYATVISWLYAIAALFALLQDPLFRAITRQAAFERAIRRYREPFYLLCGYGDTGWRVARELTEDGTRVVVVENDASRVDAADVDDHPIPVPALLADAGDPKALQLAGLNDSDCVGVVALTGSDSTNAKVVLAARLLSPALPVLSVARDHAWHPRMALTGADRIINPFDTFAERVAISIRTPSLHVIYEALTTQTGTAAGEAPKLPRGRWVLCGSGQFTRALRRQLIALNVEVFTLASELDEGAEPAHSLAGDPTDPEVLRKARVDEADALVAGTPVDVDNLAIVLAARSVKKSLFVVARQTQRRNLAVFQAAPIDQLMQSSHVVAAEVLRQLRAPLLSTFLRLARDQDEAWAAGLLVRLQEAVGKEVLESWSMSVNDDVLPAACAALDRGEEVTLARLLTRVDGSGRRMRAVPLLLLRGPERRLLPALDEPLCKGDQLLFCGRAQARSRMRGIAVTRSLAPEAGAGVGSVTTHGQSA